MRRRTGRARTEAIGAALALVLVFTGCTGPSPGQSSPSPAPPEQRLTFIWSEAIPVPPAQRPVVDTVRDWERAYQLTVTEPSSLAPYLLERSSAPLLDEIRKAMTGAPPAGGTVRVTLVELTPGDATVQIGLCEDKRGFGILVNGQPQLGGGENRARRLMLAPALGGWTVQRMVFQASDLDARCATVTPAPTAAG